ncbi:MAG: DUF4102 domain-containing protein [Gammaproteobacteria bacterium]|nr:DUF4102 domain-containing protein [Gammaproteobacteria bacterium]
MGKLTDPKVKSAKPPAGKAQIKLTDGQGLYLLVKRLKDSDMGRYWRMAYIPVILENGGSLASVAHPNHLGLLSSWGFATLPPSIISNDFGYR